VSCIKNQNRVLTVILAALIVLYIANYIAISTAYAFQQYEELLLIYPPNYDIYRLTGFGCSIERVFTKFNIALALCPAKTMYIVRELGLEAIPNFNVSLDVTFNSFKIYRSVNQIGVGEGNIPFAWSWAVSRVNADITWRYLGVSGYGATIAILDTGIDPTHPLLYNKLKGWIEFDRKGKPVCSNPRDTYGHGTWVASIAAGGDTSTYIFGVAPYANILAALVLPGGYGTAAQVLAGLEWSLDPYNCTGGKLGIKPDVVSMSFGAAANYSNIFLQAISRLIESGIVPVAAIGNSGPHTTSNPGNIWGVIGVGATNFDNEVAWFSSYEDVEWPEPPSTWPFKGLYPKIYRKPDIVAPGIDVPGAFPGGLLAIGSGTSASTPIVAGVAAMVSRILVSKGFSGVKLVEEVYDILTSTTTSINVTGSGYGLVNAFKAVSKALDRRVNVVEVKVEPSTSTLWEEVNIDVKGVVEGIELSIYIAGVEVYRGIYRLNQPIKVRIPPTHIGGNDVVVIDRGGIYYGEALISIYPTIYVMPRNTSIGRPINIAVSGLGIADLIIIYIENNILTLDIANLRGSYLSQLFIPYLPQGRYNVLLVDLSTPNIRLSTSIDIAGEAVRNVTQIINRTEIYNYTNIVKEYTALPMTINIKQHYIFNATDYIDIASAYPNITIVNAMFRSIDNKKTSYSIINITEISSGIYRIWFKVDALEPINEMDGVIYIKMYIGDNEIVYPAPIKLLSEDPIKTDIRDVEKRLYHLNSSVVDLEIKMQNISENVKRILKNLSETSNRVDKLDINIANIERNISSYGYTASYVSRKLNDIENNIDFITTFLYTAFALSITSLAIAIIFTIYRRK